MRAPDTRLVLGFTALLFWHVATLTAEAASELPAFPGAEGFGAVSKGGRGGRVIKVTNLNASGAGSLQAACEASGPRIVVFEVSGVIQGDVVISQPFITIAGQTAPGAGVTIRGMLSTRYGGEAVHDVVVRFIRARTVGGRGASGDAIQFSIVNRAILDHVSCSWAEDETVDIFTRATNVTIQWSCIEESDTQGHPEGRHNYGLIAGRNSNRISIHHCLFAHHARRNPAIGGGPFDFRNNLIYNFRDGLSHEGNYSGTPGINVIGNYYKAGPSDSNIFPFCFQQGVPYHVRNNYVDGVGLIDDPWAEAGKLRGLRYYSGRGVKQETETPVAMVTTHQPQQIYELVLRQAGCFPRDAVSTRIMQEVREGIGSWGRHEPADLMEGLKPAPPPVDSDRDGMPDAWETAHGLNPSMADHNAVTQSGYTAIEEYLNELADVLINGPRKKEEKKQDADDKGRSQTDPLAEFTGIIEEARNQAAAGDFEKAARTIQNAAGDAKSEEAKAELARLERGFRAAKQLRQWVVAGVASGRQEKIFVDFMGGRVRATIVSADETSLIAEYAGTEIESAWKALGPEGLLRLARKYAAEKDKEIPPERRQLLDDFAFSNGIDNRE